MNKYFLVLLFVSSVVFVSGCSYNKVGLPGIGIEKTLSLENISRKDYKIMETAEGQATTKYYGLWPIPVFWMKGENTSTVMFGFPSSSRAKQSAIYNAVQSVPNADAIINPRFHEESYSVGIWYNKTTV